MSTTTGNPTRAGVQTTDTLFDPLQLSRYSLRDRILDGSADPIARAQPRNVPTPLMACYYSQRGGGVDHFRSHPGLHAGSGLRLDTGIHSRDQVDGWRLVTDTVHAMASLIFQQL